MRFQSGHSGCTLVLSLLLTLSALVVRADDQQDAEAKKQATLAAITIKGGLADSVGQEGLFGELQGNLQGMIDRLDRAAKDEDLAGVVLRIRSPELGRGKLSELRDAIRRTRDAGKKVYALLDSAQGTGYLLACACDEIIMPESATWMVTGVRAEVTFFKRLMDRLGVRAEMFQVGEFKGAAEPFTRDSMSPAMRAQHKALVDDIYEQMVAMIAADRQLSTERVRESIDIGLLTAQGAHEAGLIDRVIYADQWVEELKIELAVDEIAMAEDYGKRKVDTDFSGMMGMIKLMELIMGGQRGKGAGQVQKIAVVYANGVITSGKSTSSLFGADTLGSDTLVAALDQADQDEDVVAIVVRIDSPGGSALASDLVWHKITQIEKPVVASMGDTAASGGYYIAMGCDRVFAEPGTVTGSIGVVGGKVALAGLMDKIGVTTETISRGKNSGLMSMDAGFSASERQVWIDSMEETYRQFLSKAMAGRNLDQAQMEQLAGGRVFTGRQAEANGLVDELGTLRAAIASAQQLAGLDADADVELQSLPAPRSFFDQLFESPSVSGAPSATVAAFAPAAARAAGEVELLRVLFAEPSVLLVPYRLELR
jgi:protease-4